MNDSERLAMYKAALKYIAEKCGKVCDEFEVCNHPACEDSCQACCVAMEVLKIDSDEERVAFLRQLDGE